MEWRSSVFITCCFALIVVVAYALLNFRFDVKGIRNKAQEMIDGLSSSDEMEALLNGSDINNIPGLNVISTNPSVTMANNCGKGPVRIGASGSDRDCVRVCVNSSARVVNVGNDDTYTYDSTVLAPGAYCVLGERPECNMRTSVAMMTINSVVCRSKFPRAFGGPLGNKIVACNSAKFYDPKNVFWDAARNKAVDPKEGLSLVEDLDARYGPDNDFRFGCKFNGTDGQENAYIAHPHERLQPIRNYCASMIYRAHLDVKTVFSDDGRSYECDCGEYEKTRVRNLYPADRTSPCSDKVTSVMDDLKHRKVLSLAYPCFSLYSPVSDVGRYFPCPPDQFTRRGSNTAAVSMPFSFRENDLIEHPLYAKFSNDSTVSTLFGQVIE